jgi:hypothetical protein
MDILDEEILNLWKVLNSNGVSYIMVGGFATNLHGFSRTTADMDIWIKDTPENKKKLRKSLADLGLGDFEVIESTQFVAGWSSISLNSGFELDIMTDLKGLSQLRFDECFANASTAVIAEIPIKFLHIQQLIESKRASARPKDLIDIIELEKIRKQNSDSEG